MAGKTANKVGRKATNGRGVNPVFCVLLVCVLCAVACQGLVLWRLYTRPNDGLTDRQLLEVGRLLAALPSGEGGVVPDNGPSVSDERATVPFPSGVRVCSVDGRYIAYSADGSWRCGEGDTCFIDGGEVVRVLPCLIETTVARYATVTLPDGGAKGKGGLSLL